MKTEDWLMFLKTDGSNMIVYNGFYISRYPYAPISRLTPQRQRILLNSSQHQHTYAFRPVPYAPPPTFTTLILCCSLLEKFLDSLQTFT